MSFKKTNCFLKTENKLFDELSENTHKIDSILTPPAVPPDATADPKPG